MEQHQYSHLNHNDFKTSQTGLTIGTNHQSSSQCSKTDYPSQKDKSEPAKTNNHCNNDLFLNLGSLISPPSAYDYMNFSTSAMEHKTTLSNHVFQRSLSYPEPADAQSRSASSSTSSLFDSSSFLTSYSLAPPSTYFNNGSGGTLISPMSTTAEDLPFSFSSSPLVGETICHTLVNTLHFGSNPSTSHYHKTTTNSKYSISKKASRSRKGCLTCRSRKKKCCETKPLCTECRRLGINCRWAKPGYERKNKSKNNDYCPDLYYDPEFGKIKTLRGVVEKKIVE
ncbi:unnamed protein product [Ambrosiozyma monospora]|uniref:Unnamed protein product n=1 Tax=Ambrosiozyma monospora TaxID=43982 RepID=A0A9W6T9E6_AMBMO|nr:unnamed protein product [Ambrosiozyma monospora]